MASNDSVFIEVMFNVSIEKVWRAWTEPDLILRWFGSDPNGKGLKAKMNVQVGGNFEISFKDSNGTEHTSMGRYVEVIKPHKLSFTWEWKSEPGVESFVVIELTPSSEKTLMKFKHSKLGTASAHNYLNGWKATFEKLEKIL